VEELEVFALPLELLPELELARPDVFAPCLPEAVPRLRPRPDDFPLLSAALAVSLLTSLLKLLRSPDAVWSCTSKAKPLSSNFSKKSSHEIGSREFSPL